MMRFHYNWYCSLCGGPFCGLRFASGNRWIHEAYNPEAITREETEWTGTMYILGLSNNATTASKYCHPLLLPRKRKSHMIPTSRTYLAPGRFTDDGTVHVLPGPPESRDPDFLGPPHQPLELDCNLLYGEVKGDHFTLHVPCLELFSFYITRRRGLSLHNLEFDKDALYSALVALRSLSPMALTKTFRNILDSSFYIWRPQYGLEFLAADPGLPDPRSASELSPITSHLRALISCGDGTLGSRACILPETAAGLSSRVKADPFSSLPIEILFKISGLLNDQSLFALCTASWTVHSALRVNDRFWRHRIMRVSMPWLPEVGPLLDHELMRSGADLKGLLCGLTRLTRGRAGMKSPMTSLGNRRRIWSLFEAIEERYSEVRRR